MNIQPRPFNKDWDTVIAAPYVIGGHTNDNGTWTITHSADWDLYSEARHVWAVRWWLVQEPID